MEGAEITAFLDDTVDSNFYFHNKIGRKGVGYEGFYGLYDIVVLVFKFD